MAQELPKDDYRLKMEVLEGFSEGQRGKAVILEMSTIVQSCGVWDADDEGKEEKAGKEEAANLDRNLCKAYASPLFGWSADRSMLQKASQQAVDRIGQVGYISYYYDYV